MEHKRKKTDTGNEKQQKRVTKQNIYGQGSSWQVEAWLGWNLPTYAKPESRQKSGTDTQDYWMNPMFQYI